MEDSVSGRILFTDDLTAVVKESWNQARLALRAVVETAVWNRWMKFEDFTKNG